MPLLILVPAGIVKCTIETGSLVFALFNGVITGLAVLASIAWVVVGLVSGHDGPEYFDLPNYILIPAGMGIIVFSILAFVFSVTLVRGLLQKRPSLVKAYVIYGIVVLLLCLATSVTLFVKSGDTEYKEAFVRAATVVTCVSIVYSTILLMIWTTYKKILEAILYERAAY